MSYDWLLIENKLDGLQPPARHTVLTVNGTAVGWDVGFPADVARALDDERFLWQPIGYPSATFPMGPSVDAGVAELVNQINRHPGTLFLIGYSQGAIVVAKVWRDHILNGDLHHRLGDVLGVIQYGDPLRAPGIANGNLFAGEHIPPKADGATTGGIAGRDDLTAAQTPDYYLSFAHPGDLYASAPVGDTPWTSEPQVGAYETLIYNMVMKLDIVSVLTIATEVAKLLAMPVLKAIPLVEAVLNAGLFFGQGMGSPHFTYTTAAAIRWIQQRAAQIPARAA